MSAPGWYADPAGGGGWRWWDGERWSEHTSGGVQPLVAHEGLELTLDQGEGRFAGTGGGEDRVLAGPELVATLDWGGRRNRTAGRAGVVAADGAWRIEQRGRVNRTVHVFDGGTGGETALVDYDDLAGRNATIDWHDGRRHHWAERSAASVHNNRQWAEYHLGSADGRALLWARTDMAEGHRAVLYADARAEPLLTLAATLALYLLVRWRDGRARAT